MDAFWGLGEASTRVEAFLGLYLAFGSSVKTFESIGRLASLDGSLFASYWMGTSMILTC